MLNDAVLCLEPPSLDAFSLSALLLREAISAQNSGEEALHCLAQRCSALKCVDLNSFGERDLWCFWVNIFHLLLLHARLTKGNLDHCSYIVAGHLFSLAEIEHCVLRSQMSPPRGLSRFWRKPFQRTDKELERQPCVAAPECSAAIFRCRPDWRLNLVLSTGTLGSSDSVPVFDKCSEWTFNEVVSSAMARALACAQAHGRRGVVLPYVLYRYRDDAPNASDGRPVTRWALALEHVLPSPGPVRFARRYRGEMRECLRSLPAA